MDNEVSNVAGNKSDRFESKRELKNIPKLNLAEKYMFN